MAQNLCLLVARTLRGKEKNLQIQYGSLHRTPKVYDRRDWLGQSDKMQREK